MNTLTRGIPAHHPYQALPSTPTCWILSLVLIMKFVLGVTQLSQSLHPPLPPHPFLAPSKATTLPSHRPPFPSPSSIAKATQYAPPTSLHPSPPMIHPYYLVHVAYTSLLHCLAGGVLQATSLAAAGVAHTVFRVWRRRQRLTAVMQHCACMSVCWLHLIESLGMESHTHRSHSSSNVMKDGVCTWLFLRL